MKVYVSKIIIVNRAPFKNLNIDFKENNIAVLSSINGRGKTTILSYIVDAWHEMAKKYFTGSFKGKNEYMYRLSSSNYNMDISKPSFVYIRFETDEKQHIDYVDVQEKCSEEDYNKAISLDDKISFSEFKARLNNNNFIKFVSKNFDIEKAKKFFNQNVITYFPAYRYELPEYLNDIYKLKFNTKDNFVSELNSPLEVISDLQEFSSWLMDVVLDKEIYKNENEEILLLKRLSEIISSILYSKSGGIPLRFGIGKRNFGTQRISIDCRDNHENFYPSIFNMSSGEMSLLCIFGEILRQADKNSLISNFNEITGIVLIDEIDKHLHIRLQKEILPNLLALFPNVQFIVSSHSPFLNMGLAEKLSQRSFIVDLDNFGIYKDVTINELYNEVYRMMIDENNRYKEEYLKLKQFIENGTKPLIITEGKTDVIHLKKAKEILNIDDCDIEYYDTGDSFGDSKLKLLLEQLSKIPQSRKIIGIFDRDVPKIIGDIEQGNQPFKNYTNNVYAFCIPIPENRKLYKNISIEFYYPDENIKKEKNGKCLYFDNEVGYLTGVYNTGNKELQKYLVPKEDGEYTKKVFDCNIGDCSWAFSKSVFAKLVADDVEFTRDFDFSNFRLIFDKIKEILALP